MDVKPGYKQTEIGVIPEDWLAPRIETILSEISMGPFGSDITISNFVSEGIPVLSGSNVRSERLEDSFANFVTPEKAKSLKKAVARRGDIVVTHRGTLGQISYIPESSAFDCYVISQSQFRARFIENLVTPYWVALYFHSEQGAGKLLEGKGHTGVPAIAQPTKTFRHLHLPLPPLHEQEAIAESLSDADALIESLEQLIAKKRQVKQGAMQELLTGKRRLPGFSGEWENTEFGSIAERIVGGGTPSRSVTDYWNGEIPWMTVKDFAFHNQMRTLEYITDMGLKNSASHLIPKHTLITSTRMALGKAVTFNVDVAINQDLKAIFTAKDTDTIFLYYWFELNEARIAEMGSGSTVMGISLGDLRKIPFSKPILPEQIAITTILSDMDAEIAALDAKLSKAHQIKQGMMQELLTGRIRLV
jgi:type I restriction enzyme, S subunit